MADASNPPNKGSALKKVLIGIVAVVAIFLVVVAMQPSEFTVTRSASIAAPASSVFPYVNDLHQWEKWSPWEKVDPAMKKTYEGPGSGLNASYGWAGNHEVGEGRMTITESKPNELVRMKLEFFKPMQGTNDVTFSFKQDGAQTGVTWTMSGPKSFVSKAVCMFMNMDKMVGGMFEKGLSDLKASAEAPAKK
ncbi:MAG TPA: SRPBCC family protein [Planctomycetota bacterium]|nr:SRPBCC family protein [Planctomycetota bacterium]